MVKGAIAHRKDTLVSPRCSESLRAGLRPSRSTSLSATTLLWGHKKDTKCEPSAQEGPGCHPNAPCLSPHVPC